MHQKQTENSFNTTIVQGFQLIRCDMRENEVEE